MTCFLSALTRLMGILVTPMLAIGWVVQRRQAQSTNKFRWAELIAPTCVLLGTLVFMLYLEHVFGDPFAFLHGAAVWARQPSSPLVVIRGLFQHPSEGWISAILAGYLPIDNWIDQITGSTRSLDRSDHWIDQIAVIGFLILGIVLLYLKRWAEGVFMGLGVIIPFSSGLLMS